ncbi:MAG: chromosome segregation protein SMC [Candidatus Thermoplasmatota archaeon]|nr:chromosome segregation protein SMC [Candidatus Thermoplasmatota archaeon]
MYLKRLEVENFKSFKGNVTIPFIRGFTAITGPNGSGKSNCGDAIQFVLGPRSNKVLRAKNARELIFNGGKSSKPAKHCKVTLVFENPSLSNGRRRIPIDSDEVRLTREVKVSKSDNLQTKYFLNDEESSQKTFHRLLGQANARPDGYNIVLQGDVTRLSKMTPVERRRVLESVAGVTSYDDEIKKADRQKKQVEDYIDRISLLEEEQKNRLKDLKKEKTQAEKAVEVKQLHDEAQSEYFQSKYASMHAEIAFQIEERQRLLEESQTLTDAVKEGEHVLLKLDDELASIERSIQEIMGDEGGNLSNEINELRLNCERNRDRIETAEDLNREGYLELETLEKDISTATRNLEEHIASLEQAREDFQHAQSSLQEAEDKEKKVQDTLANSQGKTQELSRALSMAVSEFKEIQAEVAQAALNSGKLETKLDIISGQVEGAKDAVEDARLNMEDLAILGDEIGNTQPDKDRTKLANEIKSIQTNETNLKRDLKAIEVRLQETTRQLVSARAELESRSGNNGLSGGASAVISARDRGELRGVLGTISELCEPIDTDHAEALATAVGGGMSSVVVETDQIAAECMAYLRQRKSGRATFLPLNKMQANRPSGKASILVNKPGVIGFAHELLHYDPRIESAVRYALRNTLIVQNLDTARKLMGGVRLVTLRGEVTEPGGAMVGGSRSRMKTGFGGKIQGANEVEKLSQEVERLTQMSENVTNTLDDLATKQDAIREKLNALSNGEHVHKVQQWRLDSDAARKAFEKERGKLLELEGKFREIEQSLLQQEAWQNNLVGQLESAELKRQVAQESLQASSPQHLKNQLLEAQTIRVEAEGLQEKAKLVIENGNEKQQLLQREVDRFTERADTLESGISGRNVEIKTWRTEIVQDEAVLNEKEAERQTFLDEHQGLDEERVRLTEERAGLRVAYSQKATEAQTRKRMAEDISRALQSKEIELHEIDQEMAEFHVQKADHPELLPSVGEAEKNLRKLARRLESLGPVNMLAIEQYQACEERLSEMTVDFKTLQNRRKQLIEVTKRLESQRKERLTDVLHHVNKNFESVYKKLSDGGKGNLYLENPNEPFQGGLDLWAQPRGKSSRCRLPQLSGGEQSMVALSLIFAIQDYDPSPFYYFDEVDQNLDPFNAELIAKMCRERSEAAQFIMVTLRKVSLRLADHHIGITHGGDGCSRRIIDFDKERAIELGDASLEEAKRAAKINQTRIEDAQNQAMEMPEVPEPLEAPKSIGGLLLHMDEATEDDNFKAIAQRAEELDEDIAERKALVEEMNKEETLETELKEEA